MAFPSRDPGVYTRPGSSSIRPSALADAVYELSRQVQSGLTPADVQAAIDASIAALKAEPDPFLVYQKEAEEGLANGYTPLDASGKVPPAHLPPLAITETFVVSSQAEMLSLTAQTGDVAIRLDLDQTFILAGEPASVLANWVPLAMRSNVTVLEEEEFAPAGGATAVTLGALPADVLSVFRNGLEQSLAAGHYAVAGAVLTFSSPFAAGERVAVVYSLGTSVLVDAYTKAQSDTLFPTEAESDLRYPLKTAPDPYPAYYNQARGDARYQPLGSYLTQATADARYLQIANAFTQALADARYPLLTALDPYPVYYNQARGDARYEPLDSAYTKTESDARYQAIGTYLTQASADLRYLQLGGGSVMTGGIGPTVSNASDLGTTALRWRKSWAVDGEFSNAPTVGGVALPTFTTADARYLQTATATATYVPLAGGNVLTGALGPATNNARDLGTTALRFRKLWVTDIDYSGVLTPAVMTQAAADLRYLQLTGGSVLTGGLGPATNNTLDAGTTALRWRKLWTVDGEFTNTPTVGGVALPTFTTADARYPLLTAPDPYAVYYNQTRGDARYLQTVNAFTQALADARYLQLTGGSVLTGTLGPTTTNTRDLGTTALRWAKVWAVNAEFTNAPTIGGAALSTLFLAIGGGTLTGALTVSAGGVAITGASTFSVAPTVGGSPLLTQTAGDARYLLPATAVSTYVPLAGGSVLTGLLGPTTTNAVDLGTTALRWRKAWAVDEDLSGSLVVAVALTVAAKAVALSPNANQSLQWLANGFFSDAPSKATYDALVARVATLEAQVATLNGQMGAGTNGHYHAMGTWRQTAKATLPATVLEEAPAA